MNQQVKTLPLLHVGKRRVGVMSALGRAEGGERENSLWRRAPREVLSQLVCSGGCAQLLSLCIEMSTRLHCTSKTDAPMTSEHTRASVVGRNYSLEVKIISKFRLKRQVNMFERQNIWISPRFPDSLNLFSAATFRATNLRGHTHTHTPPLKMSRPVTAQVYSGKVNFCQNWVGIKGRV